MHGCAHREMLPIPWQARGGQVYRKRTTEARVWSLHIREDAGYFFGGEIFSPNFISPLILNVQAICPCPTLHVSWSEKGWKRHASL